MKKGDEEVCVAQCASGDQSGCVALGLLHAEGRLLVKDELKAAKLFEVACTGGVAPGCTHLGELLAASRGVSKDEARAAALYTKACDAGDGARAASAWAACSITAWA